jgi:hypothetical protein
MYPEALVATSPLQAYDALLPQTLPSVVASFLYFCVVQKNQEPRIEAHYLEGDMQSR